MLSINDNVYNNKMNDDYIYESFSKKIEIIILVFLITCVCVLIGVLLCFLYYILKNFRIRRLNDDFVRFLELN